MPAEPGDGGVAVAVKPKRDVSRPYRVIGGLVLSFSIVTLAGSALAVTAASTAGCDSLGRVGRVGCDRPGLDLPAVRGGAGAAVRSHSAKADCRSHQWIRPWPHVGCVVRAVRRPGPGRDCGGGRDGEHRTADHHPHRGVRRGHGRAAVVLRAGRATGCRAGQCFSAPSARDPDHRRDCDHPVSGGPGVQSAGGAAAGRPGLHPLVWKTSWVNNKVFKSNSAASSTTRTRIWRIATTSRTNCRVAARRPT